MSGLKGLAFAAVMGLAAGLAGTAAADSRTVAAAKKFDRSAIQRQLRQTVQTRKVRLTRIAVALSTEMRVKMCQQQLTNLSKTLAECVAANSDPVNPPPGSPLDLFNKLTNAQLAQKCPGSLQDCLNQVVDEQFAWCKANVCKSQADAVAAHQSQCDQLNALLQQELSQPPPLKKNTPPCPDLYQAYLTAREAAKNFECHGSFFSCLGPSIAVLTAEQAALQKLKDNGCI